MGNKTQAVKLVPKRKLAPLERVTSVEYLLEHIKEISSGNVCPVKCYRVEASGRMRAPVGNNLYDEA